RVNSGRLKREAGEAGSGGIFETELTSGLFLWLCGARCAWPRREYRRRCRAGWQGCEHLVHLIATVSPAPKKGSTAPYAWADLVVVETGDHQPRSLAGAFRKPVPLGAQTGDVLDCALCALEGASGRVGSQLRCAGEAAGAVCSFGRAAGDASLEPIELDQLASWAAEAVRAGAA
ncbi:MAG: type I-E CRISPR-associated protein Cas7/Cse4/CasC, partial [Acetobacteraceae bacterium]|nr:type I-E CRISPR-associated protein Cas7/Cse4/CasC [Acetobacteraceae bacterium]